MWLLARQKGTVSPRASQALVLYLYLHFCHHHAQVLQVGKLFLPERTGPGAAACEWPQAPEHHARQPSWGLPGCCLLCLCNAMLPVVWGGSRFLVWAVVPGLCWVLPSPRGIMCKLGDPADEWLAKLAVLTKCFLLVCGLSSPSLGIAFHRAEVFNFNSVQLMNSFFHGWCLLCCISESSLFLGSCRFSLMLSSGRLIVFICI